jgi:uncharacterized protein YjiS (DUF1127 family)
MNRQTEISGPAALGVLAIRGLRRLAAGLRRRWHAHRANRERRDAFVDMLRLDDAILDDIGVTRAELNRAARLPLRIDAARALADAARTRRNLPGA